MGTVKWGPDDDDDDDDDDVGRGNVECSLAS
jgi:hypothetical protein